MLSLNNSVFQFVLRTCKACRGTSEKDTADQRELMTEYIHEGNIGRFNNCEIVHGNLKILSLTFDGYICFCKIRSLSPISL